MSAVDIIGVISGVLGIFSFVQDLFPTPDQPTAQFQFRIGLDGTPSPNGDGTLSNAGGNIPDIRGWNENKQFLAITVNDDNSCGSGDETCTSSIDTDNAPTYTLFTGNNDAICIGWMSVTFPGGDQYGNPIGNWASQCDTSGFGTGATWFYSNVIVQSEDGTGNAVNCAWIDGDGDQPTTGIQVHWIEFGSDNAVQDLSHYCANPPALLFHYDDQPSDVVFLARRNMFADDPHAYGMSPGPAIQRRRGLEQREKLAKRFESDPRIIKSYNPEHTASDLCAASGSVGPSFVSYVEKMTCYMPTKTVYSFCEEVEDGNCWDDETNSFVSKGLATRELPPKANFSETLVWEKP